MSSWPESSPYWEDEERSEPPPWRIWDLWFVAPLVVALIVGGVAWIVALVLYVVIAFLILMIVALAAPGSGF